MSKTEVFITRVPVNTIVLHRKDGAGVTQRVIPAIGQAFKFTHDEYEQLMAVNPRCLRKIVNESLPVDEPAQLDAPAPAASKGSKGAKTAAVDKADAVAADAADSEL